MLDLQKFLVCKIALSMCLSNPKSIIFCKKKIICILELYSKKYFIHAKMMHKIRSYIQKLLLLGISLLIQHLIKKMGKINLENENKNMLIRKNSFVLKKDRGGVLKKRKY